MRKMTAGHNAAVARFPFGLVALLTGLLTLLLAVVVRPEARALPDYLAQFNSTYGTSGTKLDDCATCHSGGAPSAANLNPYGTDFAGANHDFAAIEPKDSDGDGVTNIDEINARTFPGDPNDHP